MNSRFAKTLLFALQIILIIAMSGVCYLGIAGSLKTGNTTLLVKFAGTAVRCVVILVFAFFYFFEFSSTYEVTGLFMPLYLVFEILSEGRILADLGPMISRVIISPSLLVILFIFSTLMISTLLLGYGVFHNSQNLNTINYYLLITTTVNIILTVIIPKPQTIIQIWKTPATIRAMLAFMGVAAAASIIILLTDSFAETRIRFTAILPLLASTFINMFYDTVLMDIIGTAFFFIACAGIIITLKLSEGRL